MKNYVIEHNSYLGTEYPHKYRFEIIGVELQHVKEPKREFDARYFICKNAKGSVRRISITSLFDKKCRASAYRLLRDGKRVHNKLSIQVAWNTASNELEYIDGRC